jgi:enterobactin synthetase component D / holo-[acyl-carrier protein] synthase
VIEELLPAGVAAAEAFGAELANAPLFPEEEMVIADAVAKRRAEFTAVRACARQALAALGWPPAPLLPGDRGSPGWPPGLVGSMTHCDGYQAAAVARAGKLTSLGIDAEPNEPLPDGVLETVSLPGERDELRALAAAGGGVCWDRLLFSAKEALYKAWYPVARRPLWFTGARVSTGPGRGCFQATVLDGGPGGPLYCGRWLARGGLVLTAVTVPSEAAR